MKEIKVLEGQNIFDITLQEYGNIEAVFDLLVDNPNLGSINAVLTAGASLFIDEEKTRNLEIVQFLSNVSVKPSSGDLSFEFNFSFKTTSNQVAISFEGTGTVDVEFGDGFIQSYTVGDAINYSYSLGGVKEVKFRFSDLNSITKLSLNDNGIFDFVDLTIFQGLQEALLHNNDFTINDMEVLLTSVDNSTLTNTIISLYGNQIANQNIVDLVNDLAVNNNIVEIAWLELQIA